MSKTNPKARPIRHRGPEFQTPQTPYNLSVDRCPVPRHQSSHRILIMRVGAFGDILMGTPLLAALRQAYPEAHLTWVAEHNHVQAIDANPYIDEVISWDGAYWKRMLRHGLAPLWLAHALAFGAALRSRRYDIFVSFQPEEWPMLALGTGARTRIGVFDTFRRYYGVSHHLHYRRLYTHSYAEPGLPAHRADQYLLPLEALGIEGPFSQKMSMGYTAEDAAVAGRWLRWQGLSAGERYAVLVPGTSWPTKSWPSERYAALADGLARDQGCRIVLMGGGAESELLDGVASRMRTQPITFGGTLTFRQSASVVSGAAMLVSGDTGPMHMAAALGTPQVALFGATSSAWYGPRGGRSLTISVPVPCGPCDKKRCPNVGDTHERCLGGISVGDVLQAARAHSCGTPVLSQ
jgi:ADP-heptose:LPS heptosyltransferase